MVIIAQTQNGSFISRSKIIERVCLMEYSSKSFSILTEWDGAFKFNLAVFRECDKTLIELVECLEIDCAENVFDQLKTKYIFDYDNLLKNGRVS